MKAKKKSSKNNWKSKGIAFVITSLVIALLIIAGPVQGFNLGITMNDNSVDKGENVVFNVELVIESGEGLPVEYLILVLDGPEYMECKFSVDGSIISGCKGVVSIVDTKQVSYGYGYGYGYNNGPHYFGYGYGYGSGKLSYEITIDTEDYKTGFYNTEFIARIGSENFSKQGDELKINYVYQGSSGSGSSNVKKICETEYVCGEWDTCINGYQNRLCEKLRPACYAGETPEILRACGEEESEGTGPIINVGNEPENGISNSGITGAVIGDGANKPAKAIVWTTIILVLVIVILVAILLFRRLIIKRRVSGY